MPNEFGAPKPSFWSFPRKADAILALKDPEVRQRNLRTHRRLRWTYLLCVSVWVGLWFLPRVDTARVDSWFWFFLFLLYVNEQQIETILLVDLLILPASTAEQRNVAAPLTPDPSS